MGKGLSITAFVLSLLFFVPFITLVGAVLGVVAVKKAKNKKDLKGLAIASIVIGIFIFIITLFILFHKPANSNGLELTSLNIKSAAPMEMLSLSIKVPDSLMDSELGVRFSDNKNYQVDVPLIWYNDQAAIVSVPIYFTSEGNFSSGTLDVTIVANSGNKEYVSNKITGFEVEDLPTVNEQPGTITLAYLAKEIESSNSLIEKLSQLGNKNISTDELQQALVNQRDSLVSLKNNVSDVMQNQENSFVFGKFNNVDLKLDRENLRLSDRIIAGYLLQYQEKQHVSPITGNVVSFDQPVTLESLSERFHTMFDDIGQKLGENKETMTSLGETMVSVGGAISLVPGGQVAGPAVAGLGAIVWFTGLHVNTAVIMAMDASISSALDGTSDITKAQGEEYFGQLFSKGIGAWAGESGSLSGFMADNIYTLAGTANLVNKFNNEASQNQGVDIGAADINNKDVNIPVNPTDINLTSANDSGSKDTALLMVDKLGEGDGVIWDSQSFINCPGICTHKYWIGTRVILYAQARSAGTTFLGWEGGGCSGTGGSCVVTLEGDTAITAKFQKEQTTYNPPSGNGQCNGMSSSNACGRCGSDADCGGGHCWFNVGTAPFC